MMAAQFCEYTKSPWIVHFKWVNSMVSELYPNKAGFFFKPEKRIIILIILLTNLTPSSYCGLC